KRTGQFRYVVDRRGAAKVGEGAGANSPRYQPFLFELVERHADCRPRGAEGDCQLSLGWQLLAVGVGAFLDGLAQLTGDPGGASPRIGDDAQLRRAALCPAGDSQTRGAAQRKALSTNLSHFCAFGKIGLKTAALMIKMFALAVKPIPDQT